MSENVHQKIAKVKAEIAKQGIEKGQKNTLQNYAFRGIDDIYNALSGILANVGLNILPSVISRDVIERKNHKGTALFYVTVTVKYTFVSADDGSSFESIVYGEAMDSGDKATNKAMSAAYKYLCLQSFCIPTQGDNDADATTHSVSPYITEEQARELTALAVDSGVTVEGFCKIARIEKIEDLESHRFEGAKHKLITEGKKNAA